ncbi:MAG: SMP-30/gluconolactonase/LRE family protein, partial [Bacteroidales bacterium]|nr:SMP-30/gluconolactonase/LRE family protein [Bacteroidales bacterium]
MKRLPVLFSLFLLTIGVTAQSYKFFNYGTSDGLCDQFAYTINQDPQGFLWIGTTQGLCRFDGKVFEQDFKGDSIPTSIAYTSLLDSRGILWFGHANGLLSQLENGEFRLIDPGDDFRSKIMAIREDGEGNILVLFQQSGLMVINPALEITYIGDRTDPADPFAGKFLNDFQITPDGNLLAGTQDGLVIYRYDDDLETYIETGNIADLQYLVVQEIVPAINENEYWVGTEDEGLYRLTGEGFDPAGFTVEKIGIDQGLGYARITSIVFDGDRRVWITDTGVGIYRIELDETGFPLASVLFNVENGIPNEYINEVFIDEEGNQWFSSQGNGIAVLRDQAFTFFDVWGDEQFFDVTALYLDGDHYWFGGQSRIAYYESGSPEEITYFGAQQGLPDDKVTALYVDPNGDLYIGTENSGLHIKPAGVTRIRPLVVTRNSLDNIVNAIDGVGNTVFVATTNGVYSIDIPTGKRSSITTANGLPHNKINDILVDRKGRVWIATITSGLYSVKTDENGLLSVNTDEQFLIDGKPKLEFLTLAEDDNGTIWAGTDGGVFKFNDDTPGWYTSEQGLINNYAYAIGVDPKGYIWVGHRKGLSRIHPENETVRKYGKESGFDSDILRSAVSTSDNGKMYLGTTGGIIQFDAFQAREDTVAPKLSLKSVNISGTPYDPTQKIRLKYGKYRVRIDFVGINLSNPEQVTYQFKLDGYEEEWSDISNAPYASYGRIEDGDYTFLLKACDG